MKKIYAVLFPIVGIFAFLMILSFAEGFATKKNIGITTAPGDWDSDGDGVKETCAKCHTTTDFNASLDLFVTNASGQNIAGYAPGAPYKVHVKINHTMGSPSGYGFQLVGIVDSDESGMQNFPSWSSNVKEVSGILGRKYYEHKNGASSTDEFTVDWVAPADGTGNITFYGVGNAINGNNSSSGDNACKAQITLTEGLLLSNTEPISISNILVENPSSGNIHVTILTPKSVESTIGLYDLAGRPISIQSRELVDGVNQFIVDANALNNGTYILTIETATTQLAQKVLIIR